MFYGSVCKIIIDAKNIVCRLCVEKYKADKQIKNNWPFEV